MSEEVFNAEMDLKTGKVKVQAEWGDIEIQADDMLAWVRHWRRQLKHYLKKNASPNPARTKREIRGYEAILTSNSQSNARKFVDFKSRCREQGIAVPENLEIIRGLKEAGQWETKGKG